MVSRFRSSPGWSTWCTWRRPSTARVVGKLPTRSSARGGARRSILSWRISGWPTVASCSGRWAPNRWGGSAPPPDPAPPLPLPSSHIDRITSAFADFVDLKSSYTLGHSTKLAELATGAGVALGLDEAAVNDLRRAAQVHDLGNVSVPNRIWTKAGPLNRAEWERVRLHPYQSQRVLTVAEPLRVSGELAGMHHERLGGSGYHRGLPAASIPLTARLLAAAEVYQSLVEERPWRPAMTRSEAAAQLREEMRQGRFDRQAVDAVLEAARQPRTGRRGSQSWPASLTAPEVDVRRMVARGRSNKEIARALHVSEATVHTHVINVYGKIEVKTRAGAALFALEHDLIQL